jgi:DNA-binding NarL/FixJ family response regulator
MSRIRVLIADDHALLLGAFEKLLATDFDVVGVASDGRAAVAGAGRLNPDVVVLDVSMPLLNGLEAGRQIKKQSADVKLVFITMNEDPDLAAEAFRAGASGYLLKRSAASELSTAIHEVMRGRSYVTPLITDGLIGTLMQHGDQKGQRQLTPRQREVLQLLAEGHTMKEIATLLNVSPRTVAFHKYQMFEQLGVKTTAELIQYALKHHIT